MTVANVTFVTTNSVDANSRTRNLYLTEEAAGSGFTKGLRRYQQLFHDARLDHKDQKFVKAMITTGQIALGIIAYPLLGALALCGIAINAIHLLSHNNSYKSWAKLQLRDADILDIDESFLKRSHDRLLKSTSSSHRETIIAREGNEGLGIYCKDLLELLRLQIDAWTSKGLFVSHAKLQMTRPDIFNNTSRVSCKLSCAKPEAPDYQIIEEEKSPKEAELAPICMQEAGSLKVPEILLNRRVDASGNTLPRAELMDDGRLIYVVGETPRPGYKVPRVEVDQEGKHVYVIGETPRRIGESTIPKTEVMEDGRIAQVVGETPRDSVKTPKSVLMGRRRHTYKVSFSGPPVDPNLRIAVPRDLKAGALLSQSGDPHFATEARTPMYTPVTPNESYVTPHGSHITVAK